MILPTRFPEFTKLSNVLASLEQSQKRKMWIDYVSLWVDRKRVKGDISGRQSKPPRKEPYPDVSVPSCLASFLGGPRFPTTGKAFPVLQANTKMRFYLDFSDPLSES